MAAVPGVAVWRGLPGEQAACALSLVSTRQDGAGASGPSVPCPRITGLDRAPRPHEVGFSRRTAASLLPDTGPWAVRGRSARSQGR